MASSYWCGDKRLDTAQLKLGQKTGYCSAQITAVPAVMKHGRDTALGVSLGGLNDKQYTSPVSRSFILYRLLAGNSD